jgi:hypothetical protein
MSEPLREDASTANDDAVHTDPGEPGPGLPPPTAIESLVTALMESGPEVAEHVVAAARELLLAAQTIVDAAERAVQEQQELRRSDGDSSSDAVETPSGSVRHLDVAE